MGLQTVGHTYRHTGTVCSTSGAGFDIKLVTKLVHFSRALQASTSSDLNVLLVEQGVKGLAFCLLLALPRLAPYPNNCFECVRSVVAPQQSVCWYTY